MDNQDKKSEKSVVMIVDDTPANLGILEEILSGRGYEVLAFPYSEMALRAASQNPPDIILLDIMMPGMDGFEVCRRLKSNETTRDIPVIFISALGDTQSKVKAFTHGGVDYVPKPFQEEEVLARVKTHLDLKQSRQRLAEQNAKLQKLLQLQDDLSHMLIHDMRNQLNSITLYSILLLQSNILKPPHDKYVDKIKTQADNINSFINEMLMVARAEHTELQINRKPVNLEQMLAAVREFHTPSARSRAIELVFENKRTTKGDILIDAALFHRVLDNLLSNAIKFAPADSKIILQVESAVEPHQVKISIIDQGPGIPEEKKAKLFQKYEIVQMRREGVTQIGLGLLFCKIVVDAHGGSITIKDNQPQGSIFIVQI